MLAIQNNQTPIYSRKKLATSIVDLLNNDVSRPGLFLTAPRRTGKSTFLSNDLVPLLKSEGALVIYADLWEDKTKDPGMVIAEALQQAVRDESGVVWKNSQKVGMSKLRFGGIELDLNAIGTPKGASFAKIITTLSTESQKPIILIIDEAQAALGTEMGQNALFALKAARDAMFRGQNQGFRLIATGSNTDLLQDMVVSKKQAFYDATLEKLPTLGLSYLKWRLAQLPQKAELPMPALQESFQALGYRPDSLRRVLLKLPKSSTDYGRALLSLTQDELKNEHQSFIAKLDSLQPFEVDMLKRMWKEKTKFSPFSATTLQSYQDQYGLKVAKVDVQRTLEEFKKEGLVVRIGHGQWVVDEVNPKWLSAYQLPTPSAQPGPSP